MRAVLFVPDKDNFNLQKFVSSCFQISISYSFNFRYRVLSDIPRSCAASFRLPWFFPRLSRSFLFLSLPVRGILPRQLLYPRYDYSSPRRSSFAGLVQGIPIAGFHTSSGERWRWKVPVRALSCVLFCMMSYTRCFKSFMSFFMSKSILYRISRSVANYDRFPG